MNPNDNFIYAMRWTANNRNQLWVFDQSGEETFVGYVSGGLIASNMNPHFPAGAFDDNDNLYVFQNGDNTTGFHKINIKSQQAEQIILSSPVHLRDAIYNPDDGLLYGMSFGTTNDGLVSINPSTGAVTLIGGDGDGTHHAMFRGTDGAVYMMTKTYTMYNVDLSSGTLTQVAANPGWGDGGWVDGAACGDISLAADLAIGKTDTSATFIATQTNSIDVLAINADGCYGRDTIDITKNSNPTITIIQTDSVICDLIGETTTLSVTDDEGMDINWNTGASGENITVIENGEFIATKTNEFGCFTSDTVMIDRLCEEITITLPNIFTPDGDGTNENFKPIEDPLQLLTYIDVISFIVYNRWGRTMYLSQNLLPHWNGLYQDSGEPCSDGVYYWIMKYSNIQGEEKSKNGYVHLIR